MIIRQLNQSAFALGFRTIDCPLNGGLDRVSVLHAPRFVSLRFGLANTLPPRLNHFLGNILVATGVNLFRDEILTLQCGREISQHLPRGFIGRLGFNAAESIIPQRRHGTSLMAKYRCGVYLEDSRQCRSGEAEPDAALLERISADRVDDFGNRFAGLPRHGTSKLWGKLPMHNAYIMTVQSATKKSSTLSTAESMFPPIRDQGFGAPMERNGE